MITKLGAIDIGENIVDCVLSEFKNTSMNFTDLDNILNSILSNFFMKNIPLETQREFGFSTDDFIKECGWK